MHAIISNNRLDSKHDGGERGTMEISTRKKGKHCIIALIGELNLYNVGEVRRRISEEVTPDTASVVVDFKDLIHIDSSGIGLMAQLKKQYATEKGNFALMQPNKAVMDVLTITSLDNFFLILRSEDKLEV